MRVVKASTVAGLIHSLARWGTGCCLAVFSLVVGAQSSVPPSGAASVVASPGLASRLPITPGDILLLASQDERFVDRLRRQLARSDPAVELLQSLAVLEAPVEEKLRAFSAETLASLPVARLESLDRYWKFDARLFREWQAQAQRKLRPFDDAAAQVARRREVWDATKASAVLEQLPPVMLDRVDALLKEFDKLKADLAVPLARQVELSQRSNALASQIETGSGEVEDAIASIDRRLMTLDAPPLWAMSNTQWQATDGQTFSRGLELEGQFARAYASAAPVNRYVLLILQPTLLVLIAIASYRTRRRDLGSKNERAALSRPLSAWLLLSMMSVLVLEPEGPLLAHQLAMLIALVPLIRLMSVGRPVWIDRWPLVSILLYVMDSIAILASSVGPLYRLLHLGIATLALGLTVWLLRRPQVKAAVWSRVFRMFGWSAVALLASALLLNVVGNTSLSDVLVSGLVDCSLFGALLWMTVEVAKALLKALLDESAPPPLPLLWRHRGQTCAVLSRVLTWCAVAGWVIYAMAAFRIMRPVQAILSDVLGHHYEIGEISVSLGDVLVFALSILIAWGIARVVRQILDEQLSARPSLPRGVASSVASLTFYGLMVAGFFVALSAAGFKVSQLALVFGALGVGIGFGLQNIVNNFVSGLVLMFERPLRPGDVVEVAGISGRVQAIGMRATTIRTFDGAEVVVPNGSLLSNSLVNWTLVDHSRRIEIEVGVVYGSDPARVAAVLEAVAIDTPGIVAQPAPSAILKGYGDSSLDFVLRAWTMDFDSWVGIRSTLMMRIVDALNAEGIQIPFNQVDLNLRTVSDEAATLLCPASPRGAVHAAASDGTSTK